MIDLTILHLGHAQAWYATKLPTAYIIGELEAPNLNGSLCHGKVGAYFATRTDQ